MSVYDRLSDEELALLRSFGKSGSCCSDHCQCGIVYFIAGDGHGDYEDGELDSLLEKEKNDPAKFISIYNYSSVSVIEIGGERIVIGCACERYKKYLAFLESHIEEIAEFVKYRLESQLKSLEFVAAKKNLLRAAIVDIEDKIESFV